MEQVGLISSNISRTTWSNSNTELVDDQMRASSIHRVALDKATQEQHSMEATHAKCIPFPVRCLIDTSSCMSTSKGKALVKALN